MIISPPDIIIFSILVFFTFNGFRNGFIEEIGKLISLIGGFIFASKFQPIGYKIIAPYIADQIMQNVLSYLLIFIVVVFAITIIVKIVQKFIELVLLGWLNRLLGLLLGLLKGFLIISLLIFAIESIPLKIYNGKTLQNKLKQDSIMYEICENVKNLIILTIPIKNQLNNLYELKNNIKNN